MSDDAAPTRAAQVADALQLNTAEQQAHSHAQVERLQDALDGELPEPWRLLCEQLLNQHLQLLDDYEQHRAQLREWRADLAHIDRPGLDQ